MNNFLVGYALEPSTMTHAEAYRYLAGWYQSLGVKIATYGNARGTKVAFNDTRYQKLLNESKLDSIGLYTEDETADCNYCALYNQSREYLILSAPDRVDLADFVDHALSCVDFVWDFDYLYAYQESFDYGAGYGLGFYFADESHPLMFTLEDPISNWATIRRRNMESDFVRDVYVINWLSEKKLNALPAAKLAALNEAMNKFGRIKFSNGGTDWRLDKHELEAVRHFLAPFDVLGAYHTTRGPRPE